MLLLVVVPSTHHYALMKDIFLTLLWGVGECLFLVHSYTGFTFRGLSYGAYHLG